MNKTPSLVSILMPVYNVDKYVGYAIDSVLAQSYLNFELIIINDASTDNTANIIENAQKKDSRIIILNNTKNLGISESLNKGLAISNGKYISRIDGDDLITNDKIEKQVNFLEQNDIDLVGCWVKNINEKGEILNYCKYPTDELIIKKVLHYTSPILHIWTAKKELYDRLGGYRKTAPAEDYDFILRSLDLGFKVTNMPFYGYSVRLRDGNTLSTGSLKQKKMFSFLLKKYKLGLINRITFIPNEELVFTNSIEAKIHRISTHFLRKALEKHKYNPNKYIYALISLISPMTVKEIYNRFIFKLIMSKK